jgi:putative Mn2+ efflux pump MntP
VNLALLAGLLTGSDNLHFGAAFGLLPLSARRRAAFAVAFGVAELGMTLVGYAASVRLGGDVPAALALALAGALVLLTWARGADLARLAGHPSALVLLPLALSFDNLAAGAGLASLGRSGLAAAFGAGLVSAAMAALGLFASGAVGRRLPRAAAPLAGVLMLALAVARIAEALA